jgi:predicted nucleic acid-binding protein
MIDQAIARLPSADGPANRTRPGVVLDTQVVLDWLVFGDAAVAPLALAVQRGDVRWIATAPMHAELMHVLGRGVAADWRPDAGEVSRRFLRWSERCEPAPRAAPALRCRDPDDQMFIDLAAAAAARWLFTRDHALLALRRPARAHGVTVLRPADWPLPSAVAAQP